MSTRTFCNTLVISALNYQVDRYLEQLLEDESFLATGDGRIEALTELIHSLFEDRQRCIT